jgi:hypothetical protein
MRYALEVEPLEGFEVFGRSLGKEAKGKALRELSDTGNLPLQRLRHLKGRLRAERRGRHFRRAWAIFQSTVHSLWRKGKFEV